MNVKELKIILRDLDENDEVILSKDSEGNNYSPLADYALNIYVPDSKWSGEVRIKELTPELIEIGFGTEDLYDGDDGISAIVLYPTN